MNFKTQEIKRIIIKSPLIPRRCEKIPLSPPPWPSPVEGEGISSYILRSLPSLLAGEGRVRGPLRNFFTPSPLEGGGT